MRKLVRPGITSFVHCDSKRFGSRLTILLALLTNRQCDGSCFLCYWLYVYLFIFCDCIVAVFFFVGSVVAVLSMFLLLCYRNYQHSEAVCDLFCIFISTTITFVIDFIGVIVLAPTVVVKKNKITRDFSIPSG